jgi:hypothetical protein
MPYVTAASTGHDGCSNCCRQKHLPENFAPCPIMKNSENKVKVASCYAVNKCHIAVILRISESICLIIANTASMLQIRIAFWFLNGKNGEKAELCNEMVKHISIRMIVDANA